MILPGVLHLLMLFLNPELLPLNSSERISIDWKKVFSPATMFEENNLKTRNLGCCGGLQN